VSSSGFYYHGWIGCCLEGDWPVVWHLVLGGVGWNSAAVMLVRKGDGGIVRVGER